MGGGNGQKSATARARKQAEKDAEKGGGGGKDGIKSRAAAMDLKCSVCMQCFPNTQVKAAQAQCHQSRPTFVECDPEE
ncbi:unnamed protein product, partial [Symbiodinium microadriaticum]